MNKKSQIRVEELKYRLLQQRITNTRFKLPMSFDDTRVYLLAAYQAEVERRHRVFERNEHFDEQLNLIANYLTGGSKKFGLMFCGLCGNGNTRWAKALLSLVSGLYTIDRPYYHALRGTTLHYLHYKPHPSATRREIWQTHRRSPQ